MKRERQCAVCGDKTKLNVRLVWIRDFDQQEFNICLACAEAGKVNETSVENFPGGIKMTNRESDALMDAVARVSNTHQGVAELMAVAPIENIMNQDENTFLVVVKRPEPGDNFDYVRWWFTPSSGFFWGHFHPDLLSALQDFVETINEHMEEVE